MAVDLWNLLENKRLVYCWKVGTKTGWESHRDSGLVHHRTQAGGARFVKLSGLEEALNS
jgi:hypothetical protein